MSKEKKESSGTKLTDKHRMDWIEMGGDVSDNGVYPDRWRAWNRTGTKYYGPTAREAIDACIKAEG